MSVSWNDVERDFGVWMRYRGLADSTQRIYSGAVREMVVYLVAAEGNPAPDRVTRRQVEAFVRQRLGVRKPATVSAEFRALQQFWKWMVREDEITVNPMVGLEAPIVPEQPVPVLEVEQMRAVLKTCQGNSFVERRDNDFFGTPVNRAARIMAAAHGGQVLVSQALASLTVDRLPGDVDQFG